MYWVIALLPLFLAGEPQEDARVTRSYDISFLTQPLPQLPVEEWPSAGRLLLPPPGSDGRSEGGEPGGIGFSLELGAEMAPAGDRIEPETLVELIRRNIDEDGWANKRNSIEAKRPHLIIVQTPEVHEQIAGLLAALRARRARMFRIDLAVVPPEVLGDGPAKSGGILEERDLDALCERAGERGTRISLVAYNEQTVSAFSGRRRTRLADCDINQTGVLPVAESVVDTLHLGLTVEVTPLAVTWTDGPWADGVWLDLEMVRLAEAGEATRRETFFGDVESVPLREESLRTGLLVRSGQTVLAGAFEDSGAAGVGGSGASRRFAVLARARRLYTRAEKAPAEPQAEGFSLRLYDLGKILRQDAFDPESIVSLIRESVDPEAWNDERTQISWGNRLLQVTARGETHGKVEAFVRRIVEECGRTAAVDLDVFEGPAPAVLRLARAVSGGSLPAGWEATEDGKALRRLLHASLRGTVSEPMKARGVRARTFVADIQTVSGGTGFSVTTMPDIIVASAGEGFTVEGTVRPLLEEGKLSLDLEVCRAATDFKGETKVLVPAEIGPQLPTPAQALVQPAGGGSGDSGTQAAAPRRARLWLPFAIDLPVQTRNVSKVKVAIPEGKPVVLRVAEGEPGRCEVVVATARLDRGAGGGR